jgi:hypothetical protein
VVTLWRAFLLLLWCAVFACVAVLIGVYVGLIDSVTVSRAVALLPLGSGAEALRSVLPTPTALPEAALPEAALPPPSTPIPSETCAPGHTVFVHGAATLKAALGATMGEPVECERVTDASGDTEQQTTTGLVYYRASTNAVAFTNGFDHWALAPNGVVHWTGDAVDPPP